MPTRSGTIHGDNGSVGDSSYVIYTASLMNDNDDIIDVFKDSASFVKSIADSGRRIFLGADDPHEFYIHERHLFEPNGDSDWRYGYGTGTHFTEEGRGADGGGGASQDDLDSANALIVTLRDDIDSAEGLITTLRDTENAGSSGPVQRWVT